MRIEQNESFTDLRPVKPSRALVPVGQRSTELVANSAKDKAVQAITPLAKLSEGVNVRNMSPRQMADMSLDLYVAGFLEWEEYAELAFQPELHPDFDRTIGALTGERAGPDRRRDFVSDWEDRYEFERRNNPDDTKRIERSLRILTLFKKIEVPTNLIA